MPPVKMTRAEYQAKYGGAPSISATPPQNNITPVKMTRAEYQAKYGMAPENTPSQPQNDVKGGFIGNVLTGSTQKFGKTIGESVAALKNAEMFAEASAGHTKLQNDLMKRIKEKRERGEDTSRLQNALNEYAQDAPKLEDFTGDVINKTAGQVVGEGVGTGLEALSGGLFSSGKNVVASKTLSTLEKAREGAKIGAIYGGIGGGSSAMQEGEGFGGTVAGAGTGALIGGALGAAVPVAAAGIKKTRLFENATQKESRQFTNKLKDAEESIYPSFTKNEKTKGPLKDVKSVFGTKSVPDLQNNPATKPILESVVNLPDDLHIKPSDSVKVKDSKLSQGITRLHQDIANNLREDAVKEATKYSPSTFKTFMKENVLDPVEKEFGKKSREYMEAVKGIKVAEKAIEETNAYGVHTGRQKFDTLFKTENPTAFKQMKTLFGQLDPHINTVVETGRNVRNAMNSFAESLLPENHPLNALRREESNLIKALEEMRKRSTTQLNKGSIQRTLDRNPVAKKALQAVWQGTKVATGAKILGF